MCVCVCVCVCVFVCVCTHVYTCVCVCVYVCICMPVSVCMFNPTLILPVRAGVVETLINAFVFDMDIKKAVDQPRIHNQLFPNADTEYESKSLSYPFLTIVYLTKVIVVGIMIVLDIVVGIMITKVIVVGIMIVLDIVVGIMIVCGHFFFFFFFFQTLFLCSTLTRIAQNDFLPHNVYVYFLCGLMCTWIHESVAEFICMRFFSQMF